MTNYEEIENQEDIAPEGSYLHNRMKDPFVLDILTNSFYEHVSNLEGMCQALIHDDQDEDILDRVSAVSQAIRAERETLKSQEYQFGEPLIANRALFAYVNEQELFEIYSSAEGVDFEEARKKFVVY